jgi:hypothetical protein
MSRKWPVIFLFIALSAGLSGAADTSGASATQDLFAPLWTADLRGEVHHVRILDLSGDGRGVIFADSLYITSYGKSGTIYSLDGQGKERWKYLSGLLEDSYVGEDGVTVVGSGAYASYISPSGQEIWKIPTRSSPGQTIHSQTVFAADLRGSGKDDAVIASNFGAKGGTLEVLDADKNDVASIQLKGLETVSAITAADLGGGSGKEMIVGTIKYAPNTVSGSYTPSYSKPAGLYVYDRAGALRWSNGFDGAVTAVKACDIDHDGVMEVIGGGYGQIRAFTNEGRMLWEAKVEGQVVSLDCGQIEANGSLDVVAAANKVYALKGDGSQRWTYGSGKMNAVKVYDFGKVGKPDVIVGITSLRILNYKGELVYKSGEVGTVTSIDVGEISGSGYPSIVYGSSDHSVRAVDATAYAQVKAADSYYAIAEKSYREGDFNVTARYGPMAKDLYEMAGRKDDAAKVTNLLDKAVKSSDGDRYYELTYYYLERRQYGDVAESAQKAIDAYKKLNDLGKVTELQDVKQKALMVPRAELDLNLTRRFFEERRCANATDYAQRAKTDYAFLKNDTIVAEADVVIAKCQSYVLFDSELEAAYGWVRLNNFGNATYHLSLAQKAYYQLNDTSLSERYDNVSAMAYALKRGENVITYGGVGVVLLIVLLIAAAIVLVLLYFVKAGGFSALEGLIGDRGATYEKTPGRDGSRGGLRGLRGKSGESIGSSFKR